MASISLKYKSKQGTLTAPGDVDPGAMIPIATNTVGAGGASSITFSSIPQTYTHLQVRALSRGTYTTDLIYINMQINSDTGSNYTWHRIFGNGSTVTAYQVTGDTSIGLTSGASDNLAANIYNPTIIDILDYTNTNKYKTVRTLGAWDSNGDSRIAFSSGLWINTNAITTITIYPNNLNWKQYSSFALYGIKGA